MLLQTTSARLAPLGHAYTGRCGRALCPYRPCCGSFMILCLVTGYVREKKYRGSSRMQDLARSLEDRHGADGACGATADLEWKADEEESAAPHQLVEIGKAFPLCDSPLATSGCGLEV